MQKRVWWYANCGFSFRSSVSASWRIGTRPKSASQHLPIVQPKFHQKKFLNTKNLDVKKSILILAVLLPLFGLAQNEKSSFFIETGVTLFGGRNYTPTFVGTSGISYWQYKHFTERNGQVELFSPYNYNITYYSIAPRVGYFLSKKTSVGLDFQYASNFNSHKESYRNVLAGIFLRYYILNRKNSPFIEVASGTGLSKEVTKSTSPGGANYEKIEYFNLPYISGSAGYSFRVNSRFKLGIAATVQNTFLKPGKKSNFITDTAKISILETGLIASVSYNFKINRKKKE